MVFDPDSLDARDPALIARVLPRARAFVRAYVRLRVIGHEHVLAIPRGQPALYVANHNGGIADPGVACMLVTLWDALGPSTPLYALAHDFAMRVVTPLGRVIQRFGAIRASQENALRALEHGAHVLVYPGGDLDAFRHSRRRDEVVLGERTGFVRLAQRAGVPIVPIVAHGAHRSAYIFDEGEAIVRALDLKRRGRLARFPIALALPWIVAAGPLPYLPLPLPIRMRVLPPMRVAEGDDPIAAREAVRGAMQAALDAMAREAQGAA